MFENELKNVSNILLVVFRISEDNLSSLLSNSLFSSITLGLRFISNAILFVIIARYLGAEEFGKFTLAISITGIFLVIVDYGFNMQIVRDIATDRSNISSLVNSIITSKLILSVISTVVLVVVLYFIGYPAKTMLIIWIAWIAMLFYSFGQFCNSLFRGFNKFQFETYPTILLNIIQIVLVVIFLICGLSTLSIMIAYLISRIVYFIISFSYVRLKLMRISYRFSFGDGLKSLRESLSFGIHTIISALYFQIDTVLLSYFKGDIEVGYYQAAMRLVLATMILSDIISAAFFPIIAKSSVYDKATFEKMSVKFNKYLILSGCGFASVLYLLAEPIILSLYGNAYHTSITLLQLLSIVVLLRFAGGAYAAVITVTDNQGLRAAGVFVSLIVNLMLNYMLIPLYGASGAAISSIITHLVLVTMYFVFTFRLTGNTLLSKRCSFAVLIIATHTLVLSSLGGICNYLISSTILVSMTLALYIALEYDERNNLLQAARKCILRV